ETSRRMRAVRQDGTGAELQMRALCREAGIHYRTKNRDLPGSPDLANRSRKWAIFVHGCFWHGHDCPRGRLPATNQEFWEAKHQRNRERDKRVEEELRSSGYEVVVVWECQLRDREELMQRLQTLSTSTE